MGEIAGRPANARADFQHAAVRPKLQPPGGGLHRLGSMIVELVEGEELLGRKPVARRDAELSQFSLDAIGMEIERHRCDSAVRDHDVSPYAQNRSLPDCHRGRGRVPGAPPNSEQTAMETVTHSQDRSK